jgi:hypothetical protein
MESPLKKKLVRPDRFHADDRAAGRSFARSKDRGSSGAHAESAGPEREGDFRGTFQYRTYRDGAGKFGRGGSRLAARAAGDGR